MIITPFLVRGSFFVVLRSQCCGGVHQIRRIKGEALFERRERRRKRKKGKPGVRRASWEGSRRGGEYKRK